jgi:hypothetical protein
MASQHHSEQLFSLLKEWGQCDLLLDRELSDPLAAALASESIRAHLHQVNPLRATSSVDKCLMLARLSLAELPILDESLAIASAQCTRLDNPVRSIGGWLFSHDISADRVARQLERTVVVHIQNAPDALLRLWDSRVLPHLQHILTPEQLAAAFGPIACWAWMDRNGQLQVMHRPAIETTAYLPLRLTTEQDQAIDRIEQINTLLKTLDSLGHAIDSSKDRELDELLQLARSKGHDQVPDMLAYCLHALLVSKSFDALPEVHHAIAQAHAEGLGLCAALEPFDDAYWAASKTAA